MFGTFLANAAQTDSGYQYIADSSKKTAQITGYTGSSHSLTIPSVIEGYSVTSIKSEAFKGKNTILSVTIPDTVTNIGSECFSGCTLLGVVDLGKGVSSIGSKAFENCSILSTISIPAATSSIGAQAFIGCKKLKSIEVSSGNLVFTSKDGVLLTRLETSLITYPPGRSNDSYTAPDVLSIENYAFQDAKSLKTLILSKSTTTIGKGAFKGCSALERIATSTDPDKYDLPEKLTKIDDEVFSGCKKLSKLSFPSSIKSIGADAFKDCVSITKFTIPDNITTIGTGAFSGCSGITSVTINKKLTAISGSAFAGCSGLKEYKVPDGASFTVAKGVLFNKEGTRLIAYPAGSEATEYKVGEKVTTIGENAFDNCKNLKKLTIPATVKKIVEPAVRNCDGLTIYVEEGSEAQKYFQEHTSGFSSLKIGSDKPGDVNGDGEVDNADVILLRRYVAKWKNVAIHTESADVNKDGEVDNADVILLRRYVAGWKNVKLK
ncbi:MAG: leucine-rich repeat protein [Clostridia bacterium]|nr:leucine-rich repeat protein [Clostridia bacterium]